MYLRLANREDHLQKPRAQDSPEEEDDDDGTNQWKRDNSLYIKNRRSLKL